MDHTVPPPMPRLHITPDEARRARIPSGQLSALLLSHGSMALRWFAPEGDDEQTPHDKDEVYIVASGTAVFLRADARAPFGDEAAIPLHGEDRVTVRAGDALFVPAGTVHRFEAMSADFGTWVVFYGPEGGEQP